MPLFQRGFGGSTPPRTTNLMPRYDIIPEYEIPAPNGSNRVWLTQDGVKNAGTQGQPETDLCRMRKAAQEKLDIEVTDTDK